MRRIGFCLVATAWVAATTACNLLLDIGDDPTVISGHDAAAPVVTGAADAAGGSDASDAYDAADTPEAAPSNGPCDLTKPFGAPVPIASLSSLYNDFDARLTLDELTVYFTTNRITKTTEGKTIMMATRATKTGDFGTPTLVDGVNLPNADTFAPSITADGLELFFNNNQGVARDYDIWVGTRTSQFATTWSVHAVTDVNTSSWEANPMISPDGLSLYFFSDRGGNDDASRRLYVSKRITRSGHFGEPLALFNQLPARSSNLAVAADELTLAFSTPGPDAPVGTPDDIWISHRSGKMENWGAPVRVDELSSPRTDNPTWLSPDGCRIYMQSDRLRGARDDFDLYMATKPK